MSQSQALRKSDREALDSWNFPGPTRFHTRSCKYPGNIAHMLLLLVALILGVSLLFASVALYCYAFYNQFNPTVAIYWMLPLYVDALSAGVIYMMVAMLEPNDDRVLITNILLCISTGSLSSAIFTATRMGKFRTCIDLFVFALVVSCPAWIWAVLWRFHKNIAVRPWIPVYYIDPIVAVANKPYLTEKS